MANSHSQQETTCIKTKVVPWWNFSVYYGDQQGQEALLDLSRRVVSR